MSVEGLEEYSADELIEELMNRSTFAGVILFNRSPVRTSIEPLSFDKNEFVMVKSPPLNRQGVELFLK